jgi:hypothetical protein
MNVLFAQGRQQGGGPDAGIMMGVLCFYGVIFAVALVVQIMFLLTMSRCLKEISSRNRKMEPGQVWLCLIPLFGYVWSIIMVLRVAESLEYEFEDRRLRGDGDYGKTLGLVYLIGSLVCGPVGLVCWIMYWVKISGYTKQMQREGGGDFEDDDDYDDRPRKKKRRRRDDFDDEDDDYDDRHDR